MQVYYTYVAEIFVRGSSVKGVTTIVDCYSLIGIRFYDFIFVNGCVRYSWNSVVTSREGGCWTTSENVHFLIAAATPVNTSRFVELNSINHFMSFVLINLVGWLWNVGFNCDGSVKEFDNSTLQVCLALLCKLANCLGLGEVSKFMCSKQIHLSPQYNDLKSFCFFHWI